MNILKKLSSCILLLATGTSIFSLTTSCSSQPPVIENYPDSLTLDKPSLRYSSDNDETVKIRIQWKYDPAAVPPDKKFDWDNVLPANVSGICTINDDSKIYDWERSITFRDDLEDTLSPFQWNQMEFNFGGEYGGGHYSQKIQLAAFQFVPQDAITLSSSSSTINVDAGSTSSSIYAVSHYVSPSQLHWTIDVPQQYQDFITLTNPIFNRKTSIRQIQVNTQSTVYTSGQWNAFNATVKCWNGYDEAGTTKQIVFNIQSFSLSQEWTFTSPTSVLNFSSSPQATLSVSESTEFNVSGFDWDETLPANVSNILELTDVWEQSGTYMRRIQFKQSLPDEWDQQVFDYQVRFGPTVKTLHFTLQAKYIPISFEINGQTALEITQGYSNALSIQYTTNAPQQSIKTISWVLQGTSDSHLAISSTGLLTISTGLTEGDILFNVACTIVDIHDIQSSSNISIDIHINPLPVSNFNIVGTTRFALAYDYSQTTSSYAPDISPSTYSSINWTLSQTYADHISINSTSGLLTISPGLTPNSVANTTITCEIVNSTGEHIIATAAIEIVIDAAPPPPAPTFALQTSSTTLDKSTSTSITLTAVVTNGTGNLVVWDTFSFASNILQISSPTVTNSTSVVTITFKGSTPEWGWDTSTSDFGCKLSTDTQTRRSTVLTLNQWRPNDDKYYDYIFNRTFSISQLGHGLCSGTGWIYARSGTEGYKYYVMTNLHVRKGMERTKDDAAFYEPEKALFATGTSSSDYSHLDPTIYPLGKYQAFSDDFDWKYSSELNGNTGADMAVCEVNFGTFVADLSNIKARLDAINNMPQNQVVNFKTSSYSTQDAVNQTFYGVGYPFGSNSYSMLTKGKARVRSINVHSPSSLGHDTEGGGRTTADEYTMESNKFAFGDGASGTMVIDKNGQVVGIYWGRYISGSDNWGAVDMLVSSGYTHAAYDLITGKVPGR